MLIEAAQRTTLSVKTPIGRKIKKDTPHVMYMEK